MKLVVYWRKGETVFNFIEVIILFLILDIYNLWFSTKGFAFMHTELNLGGCPLYEDSLIHLALS